MLATEAVTARRAVNQGSTVRRTDSTCPGASCSEDTAAGLPAHPEDGAGGPATAAVPIASARPFDHRLGVGGVTRSTDARGWGPKPRPRRRRPVGPRTGALTEPDPLLTLAPRSSFSRAADGGDLPAEPLAGRGATGSAAPPPSIRRSRSRSEDAHARKTFPAEPAVSGSAAPTDTMVRSSRSTPRRRRRCGRPGHARRAGRSRRCAEPGPRAGSRGALPQREVGGGVAGEPAPQPRPQPVHAVPALRGQQRVALQRAQQPVGRRPREPGGRHDRRGSAIPVAVLDRVRARTTTRSRHA